MRTKFFCTNFLNTARGPGHPGKIPGTSRIPLFETQGRQSFEGGHEVFGHHPFAWKTPTPPGGLRTQKLSLCALFSCLIRSREPPPKWKNSGSPTRIANRTSRASQSCGPGIARISAAGSTKVSGIAAESQKIDSESPIRIAAYQCLAATVAFRERPSGLIQHVLTVLAFLSWVLLRPRPPPFSRSLRVCPWTGILLHGPLDNLLGLAARSSRTKTGRTAQVFAAQGRTRRHT